MVRITRIGHLLAVGVLSGFLLGCGDSANQTGATGGEKTERAQSTALSQVGDMLRTRAEEGSKPAAKVADFAKYERLFAVAYPKVKSGDIVVFLGTPLDPAASDKVIAYEKQVPESGGHVLMQDGTTIKKMTADEFKSASKAGTETSAPGSAKAK